MKDRYKLNLGRISKDRKIMGVNEILADLNELSAKANPEPEEVRESLGVRDTVRDLWGSNPADLNGAPLKLSNGDDVELIHVTKGDREWIEIAIPDGAKDVPYQYKRMSDFEKELGHPVENSICDVFRFGFEAARMVKP